MHYRICATRCQGPEPKNFLRKHKDSIRLPGLAWQHVYRYYRHMTPTLIVLAALVCAYLAGMVMALPYVDRKGYWHYASGYAAVVALSVAAMVWGLA